MSIIEWSVITGGLTAIGWVNWYFFIASVETSGGARNNGESRETSRR